MDQRHLPGDAYRTAVRALNAALDCPVMSFGPIARRGVESWLPCVRELPMS